jgi:hypothetical protein
VVVIKRHEKVRVEVGFVIVNGSYEDTIEMERKGDCEGAFSVLDDFIVKRETEMVVSNGVVGLKKNI